MFNFLKNWKKADFTKAAFPKFQELPPEIRFMIWELAAANPPRRILITDNQFNIPSPSTLFVNSESEAISKKVLRKLFNGQTLTGSTHGVYFCPEIDTIAFEDFRNFSFPQDHLIYGLPNRTYRFPSQPECDSVRILELEEDLGMWMYNAVHFGSLDRLILRTGISVNNYSDRVLQEAKKYYKAKLANGNCTKIPEIIIRVERDLIIRSTGAY